MDQKSTMYPPPYFNINAGFASNENLSNTNGSGGYSQVQTSLPYAMPNAPNSYPYSSNMDQLPPNYNYSPQQPVPMDPPSTIIQVVPPRQVYQPTVARFIMKHQKATSVIGKLQVSIGCIVFIFHLVSSVLGIIYYYSYVYSKSSSNTFYWTYAYYSFSWSGLWSGVFYIAAGACAIVAAKNESKGHLIATLVLSIFAAVFWVTNLALLSVDVDYYLASLFSYPAQAGLVAAAYALCLIALIACIFEGAMAITQAALACVDCCPSCRKNNEPYFARKRQATMIQQPVNVQQNAVFNVNPPHY